MENVIAAIIITIIIALFFSLFLKPLLYQCRQCILKEGSKDATYSPRKIELRNRNKT
jgi:hypothetical protein